MKGLINRSIISVLRQCTMQTGPGGDSNANDDEGKSSETTGFCAIACRTPLRSFAFLRREYHPRQGGAATLSAGSGWFPFYTNAKKPDNNGINTVVNTGKKITGDCSLKKTKNGLDMGSTSFFCYYFYNTWAVFYAFYF